MRALALALLFTTPVHAAELSSRAAADALGAAARAALPASVSNVGVERVSIYGHVDQPDGAILAVRWDGPPLGTIRADIDVVAAGAVLGSVRVTALIRGTVSAVRLVRGLARGDVITASDVSAVAQDASSLPAGAVLDASAAVGRRPRRDLALGALLISSDLEAPVDGPKGMPVAVILRSGALRVATTGALAADAAIGELVDVRTGRGLLRGTLVAARTVEIALLVPEP
jgi:flagella basal body P-ring formation protein FlgA